MGNYKDHTMEQLANKGNGNNYYIDSISEARKSLPSRPGQADRLEFIRLMGGEEGEAGGFLATGDAWTAAATDDLRPLDWQSISEAFMR